MHEASLSNTPYIFVSCCAHHFASAWESKWVNNITEYQRTLHTWFTEVRAPYPVRNLPLMCIVARASVSTQESLREEKGSDVTEGQAEVMASGFYVSERLFQIVL